MSIAITQESFGNSETFDIFVTKIRSCFRHSERTEPTQLVLLIQKLGASIEHGVINYRDIDSNGSLVSLLKEVRTIKLF